MDLPFNGVSRAKNKRASSDRPASPSGQSEAAAITTTSCFNCCTGAGAGKEEAEKPTLVSNKEMVTQPLTFYL